MEKTQREEIYKQYLKRKKEKMKEEDKKAELNSEILENYQKKESKNIKKIFITLFLLGVLGYIVNFLIRG
jgi:hypothetical protein